MQPDTPAVDTSEQIYISSLALLKMLKHGRAGVPMEVMGLMLGDFVDDYTVRVVDVFAMPQSGTGVSVEAVDPVFQTKMLDMLKQTGRPEMVVGWYHSHPGFGCWLSGVDVNTQQSFEALNQRAVAVVVDVVHLGADAREPQQRAPEVAQVRERVERDEVGAEHAEHHLAALRQAADHLVRRERHVQEEADAQPAQAAPAAPPSGAL